MDWSNHKSDTMGASARMSIEVETKDCTQLSDVELAELADLCAESPFPHEIGTLTKEAESWVLVTQAREDGKLTTEATVKIRIGDEIRHEVAEGDGPVNALDAAMRKALNGHFPALRKTHLIDYKVRVINSEAATAAGVRVIIETQDETDLWGTVGVSENIIEASWIALIDSLEYKLCKDEEKDRG